MNEPEIQVFFILSLRIKDKRQAGIPVKLEMIAASRSAKYILSKFALNLN